MHATEIPTPAAVRLRRGYHLIPATAGDPWLLYQPDGTFLRLRAEPERVARLAAFLAGEADPDDPGLRELLEGFEERGLIEAEPADSAPDLRLRSVTVRGEGPLAETFADLLREAGVGAVREESDTDPLTPADLIVACAGWLPDSRWLALDTWCAERRIPWHGCHAEGLRIYLGPLIVPGETASYADARARRLAASHHPEELLAYWRYLDAGVGVPPVSWPDAGARAAIAGALAADALAVLRGASAPSAGCQTGFEPSTWTWTRHPVLPVPRTLTEAP